MPSIRVRPPLRQDDISDDAGFTVLEAVVSFVLFAVVSAASITSIVSAEQTSNSTRDRVTAANLAQQDLQQARAAQAPNYASAKTSHVSVDGLQYTVTRTIGTACPVSSDPNNPGIAWTPGQATSMTVTTTVTWPGSSRNVAMSTEIAC